MNVEFGKFGDGGMAIVTDAFFEHRIRRVEYYRDQRLILLVYDQEPELQGELMHYELSDAAVKLAEASDNVTIIMSSPDRKVYGYDVSLVKV